MAGPPEGPEHDPRSGGEGSRFAKLGQLARKGRKALGYTQEEVAQAIDPLREAPTPSQVNRFEMQGAALGVGLDGRKLQRLYSLIEAELSDTERAAFVNLARSQAYQIVLGPTLNIADELGPSWKYWLDEGQRLAYTLHYHAACHALDKAIDYARLGSSPAAEGLVLAGLAAYHYELSHSKTANEKMGEALVALRKLNPDVPDPKEPPSEEMLKSRLGPSLGDKGLEAYARIARVQIARAITNDDLVAAKPLLVTMKRVGRVLADPKKDVLAEALHWIGSWKFETATQVTPNEVTWRTINLEKRLLLHEALQYLDAALKARPDHDWRGQANEWREQAKVLRLLEITDGGFDEKRKAEWAEGEARNLLPDERSAISLYLHQGRWAVAIAAEDPQIARTAEGFLLKATEIAWQLPSLTNLSKALGSLGELYYADKKYTLSRHCCFASFLVWPMTLKARDPRRIAHLCVKLFGRTAVLTTGPPHVDRSQFPSYYLSDAAASDSRVSEVWNHLRGVARSPT